jgi:hypothetical protein
VARGCNLHGSYNIRAFRRQQERVAGSRGLCGP